VSNQLEEEDYSENRVDRVNDERTLHSFDVERLFPPSVRLSCRPPICESAALKTALPAYRFLATNATPQGPPRLACERASSVLWRRRENEEEFAQLQPGFGGPFLGKCRGLRHPVQVTLSANPDDGTLRREDRCARKATVHSTMKRARETTGCGAPRGGRPRSESLELTPENKNRPCD